MTFEELHDHFSSKWKPFENSDELHSPNNLIILSKKRMHFWYALRHVARDGMHLYLNRAELEKNIYTFAVVDNMIVVNDLVAFKYE